MKICNYQDELLANLTVQPAQILDLSDSGIHIW